MNKTINLNMYVHVIRHLRTLNGDPYATFVAIYHPAHNKITYGWAISHAELDTFSSKDGVQIALGRAIANRHDLLDKKHFIPPDLRTSLPDAWKDFQEYAYERINKARTK